MPARPIVAPRPGQRFDVQDESAFRRMVEDTVRDVLTDLQRVETTTDRNVLAFGADPTGNIDSSGAIQQALDTDGIARIPRGTYSLDSTIVVADEIGRAHV